MSAVAQGLLLQAAVWTHCAKSTQSGSAPHALCTSLPQFEDFVFAQLLQVLSGFVGVDAQIDAEHALPQLAGLQRHETSAPT